MSDSAALLVLVARGVQDNYFILPDGKPTVDFFEPPKRRCSDFVLGTSKVVTYKKPYSTYCFEIPKTCDRIQDINLEILLPPSTTAYPNYLAFQMVEKIEISFNNVTFTKVYQKDIINYYILYNKIPQKSKLLFIGDSNTRTTWSQKPVKLILSIGGYMMMMNTFSKHPTPLPLISFEHSRMEVEVTLFEKFPVQQVSLFNDIIFDSCKVREEFRTQPREPFFTRIEGVYVSYKEEGVEKLDVKLNCNYIIKYFVITIDPVIDPQDKFDDVDKFYGIDGLDECFEELIISFNGQYLTKLEPIYFREYHARKYFNREILPRGMYVYSLCVNPLDLLWSGSLNASRINGLTFSFKFPKYLDDGKTLYPKMRVRITTESTDIIRIMSGLIGLAFSK